jgi:hypothetical protein
MPKYAAKTEVSANKSREEIERTLQRYGATGFIYGWQDSSAIVGFTMNGKQIKFLLQMPDRNDKQFTEYQRGYSTYYREESAAAKLWEQATRQRWRALALCVKAKLEAVEAGISTFENEFLAHIVLADGQTVGDWIQPQLDTVYLTGKMPPLLPGMGGTSATT